MESGRRGTALIVPVPEAERLVARFRAPEDAVRLAGVPAHVTLNVPFLPPERIDDTVLATLDLLFRRTPAFAFSLAGLGAFPGVLWLAPDPDVPFRELIDEIVVRYPEAPPYGGVHEVVVPHLTLAVGDDHGLESEVAEAAFPALPIACAARAVWLLAEDDDGVWQTTARFPLGGLAAP
jgi:2'-5' RNA ligase